MSDGSIIIDTRIDQNGFEKGSNTLKKSLKGLSSSLTKLAAITGVAFSVKAIYDYAKASNEAYKSLSQNEAKLATVMRVRMGATDDAIKSVLELTSAEEKLGVVGGAEMLAGAQELATYLDSTEALKKAIPILNNIATQQYGVEVTAEQMANTATMVGKVLDGQLGGLSRWGYSWTAAEEKILETGTALEKVEVLSNVIYNSVGDMNYALAQTDAGRQKQLANAFGSVKEQFGKAFTQISVLFIPALKVVANGLAVVANLARQLAQWISIAFSGKKLEVKETEKESSAIGGAVSNQKDLTDEVKETGKAAKRNVAGFDEIMKLTEQTGDAQEDLTDSFEGMGGDIGTGFDFGINGEVDTTQIDNFVSKVQERFTLLKSWFDTNFGDIFANIGNGLQPQIEGLKTTLTSFWGEIKKLGSPLKAWFNTDFTIFLQTFVSTAGSILIGLFDSFNLVFSDILSLVMLPFLESLLVLAGPITQFFTELTVSFGVAFNEIKNLFDLLWMEGVRPALGLIKNMWLDLCKSIADFWYKWGSPIFENFNTAIKNIGMILETMWTSTFKPIWDNLMESIDWLWTDHLKPLLDNFLDFSGEVINGILAIFNVLSPVLDWLVDILGPAFAETFNFILNIVGTVIGTITDIINGLITVLKGIVQFIVGAFTSDWEKAWDGVKNIFKGVWDSLGGIAKGAVNIVIDIINGLIKAVEVGLNAVVKSVNKIIESINSISDKVGFTLPTFPELNLKRIPKLAQGAVIPPNQEFLAVLGDQKHGTNIEAPMETIKQGFREVAGELVGMLNTSGTDSSNRDITVIMQVDNREFGRAVYRANNEEQQRVGVRLLPGGAY